MMSVIDTVIKTMKWMNPVG